MTEVNCHRCQGTGKIDRRNQRPVEEGATPISEETCPDCNGSGKQITVDIMLERDNFGCQVERLSVSCLFYVVDRPCDKMVVGAAGDQQHTMIGTTVIVIYKLSLDIYKSFNPTHLWHDTTKYEILSWQTIEDAIRLTVK